MLAPVAIVAIVAIVAQQRPGESFVVKGPGLEAREAGLAAANEGRFAEAVPLLKRAANGDPPTATEAERSAAARTENALGGALKETGKPEAAADAFRRALTLLLRPVKPRDDAAQSEVAIVQSNLGAALAEAGRVAEAEAHYRKALTYIDASADGAADDDDDDDDPSTVRVDAHADILNNMADLRHGSGRLTEAHALHARALRLRERALGESHGEIAGSLNNMATVLMDLRRHEEALPLLRRAVKVTKQAAGKSHPRHATALSNLAGALTALSRPEKALPHLKRAVAINRKALGAEHASTTDTADALKTCEAEVERRAQSPQKEPAG